MSLAPRQKNHVVARTAGLNNTEHADRSKSGESTSDSTFGPGAAPWNSVLVDVNWVSPVRVCYCDGRFPNTGSLES